MSQLTNEQIIANINEAAKRGWGSIFRQNLKEAEKRGIKVRVRIGNAATGTSPYREDRMLEAAEPATVEDDDGPQA